MEEEYISIISLLYDHLSDRNLAEVLSFCIMKDRMEIYNDIAQYHQANVIEEVKLKLNCAGFEEWINEE
jgi:hypothetical protein